MLHGFINLHKPHNWTSHDCVARVRRLLNTQKVGHGGTLDPLATGVLPLAVGKATRLLQYLPEGKAYRAIVRFGLTTSTDDLEGTVVQQRSAAHLQRQQVEALFTQFVGAIAQTPPSYSAVQVDGKRLYDLARKGKAVEAPVRQVVIHQLHSRRWHSGDQPELTVDVVCGPGTYIRSLARDLGEAVGTGATLVGLVRSHSNGFDLEESITLEDLATALERETFMPVTAGMVMQHLQAIALPSALARRWCLGQKLALEEVAPYVGTQPIQTFMAVPIRVLDETTQTFLGIAEFRAGSPTADTPTSASATPTETDASQQSGDTGDTTDEATAASGFVFAPKRVFVSPEDL